jgi:hypothetical protein
VLDRSTEVEGLVAELMAWMKAGDSTGVSELFTPGAATLLVGNGPGDWYSGSDATVAACASHLRPKAVSRPNPEPAAWAQVPVAWFADQMTAAFAQAPIALRNTGVASATATAGTSSRSSCPLPRQTRNCSTA